MNFNIRLYICKAKHLRWYQDQNRGTDSKLDLETLPYSRQLFTTIVKSTARSHQLVPQRTPCNININPEKTINVQRQKIQKKISPRKNSRITKRGSFPKKVTKIGKYTYCFVIVIISYFQLWIFLALYLSYSSVYWLSLSVLLSTLWDRINLDAR